MIHETLFYAAVARLHFQALGGMVEKSNIP